MERRSAVRIGVKGQVCGGMILADSIEIEDISVTGVRFKSMRRLEMNCPHRIKGVDGGMTVVLKGTIFKGLQQREGHTMPVYEVGTHFDDMTDREKTNIEKRIGTLCNE